jgi:glutathione peroxidase
MFAKVEVNGRNASPIYQFLKAEAPEGEQGDIEWNFTKFLVDRAGHVAARLAPRVTPEELAAPIERLL